MTRRFDVLCVGLATLDTIFAVPRHPGPDDRVVATDAAVAGGGPAATAAVTLARLGVDVAFAGAVGDDGAGAEIRAGLEREGVDVSLLATVPGARSPRSSILVGPGAERTIVHLPGTAPIELGELPEATWVHADHAGYAAVRGRGLRLSVDGGNPIDGLDLSEVTLYAPTERSLALAPEDALSAGACLVVVTRGARGCAAYTRHGDVLEVPAPPIEPVSTLGAGDVFHGALLAQLVREMPLREALVAASDVAAASCRALDGRSAIPRA